MKQSADKEKAMDADAKERIAKSTQEQAVAAWTHWLNEEVQKKVDAMLAEQDGNLEKALAEMQAFFFL